MMRSDVFDRYYAKPDPYRTGSYFPERLRLQRTWEWVERQHYCSVLDIGAGEGIWTVQLVEVSQFIVACDISSVALRRALRNYGSRLNYVVADLSNLCFAPDSFDLVCCMTSLGCLPRDLRPQAIEAIHGLLVPGGCLLLVDAIMSDKFMPGELAALLQGKFKIEKTRAGNLRVPLLGRLATLFPSVFGKLYKGLTALADRAPERWALHVLIWAQKI